MADVEDPRRAAQRRPAATGIPLARWTKPPGAREFEQVVEFTLFDRPHRFHTHIVEGPYPIDGAWTFMPEGDGTTVDSLAEGTLRGVLRLLEPIATRLMRRQFVSYHENLRRNVEALDQPQKPAPELRPIRVSRRLGQTHARC